MKIKHSEIKKEIKRHRLFLKQLKEILDERQENIKAWLQNNSMKCTYEFMRLLESRNFEGKLVFDHINGKLDIIARPSIGADDSQACNLSGGERSFCTVAFLLALWSTIESPMLFLDEFDVFMVLLKFLKQNLCLFKAVLFIYLFKDPINRRFAIALILNTIKNRLPGQYVFLTPQDMR